MEIKVFGTEMCHDTMRSRQHLEQRGIDYEFVNIDEDSRAEQQVIQWGSGKRRIPVIEIGGRRVTEPSNAELDELLGENAA